MARYVTVRGLDALQLVELKVTAERELVHAVRHRAPAGHISALVGVLDKVDRRMDRLEPDAATVERRQAIADRGPTIKRGGSHGRSKIVAPLDRRPRVRREPAPVRTTFVCPVCYGPHPRAECPARSLRAMNGKNLRSTGD